MEVLIQEVERVEQEARQTSRFMTCDEADLNKLFESANAKGTKRNTKWAIKLIEGKQ